MFWCVFVLCFVVFGVDFLEVDALGGFFGGMGVNMVLLCLLVFWVDFVVCFCM